MCDPYISHLFILKKWSLARRDLKPITPQTANHATLRKGLMFVCTAKVLIVVSSHFKIGQLEEKRQKIVKKVEKNTKNVKKIAKKSKKAQKSPKMVKKS